MRSAIRLAAISLLLGLGAAPAIAADLASPVGSWQSSDGKARVKVTLCGDGTQLCAELTGLGGDAKTAKNLQLLHTYVVDGAEQDAANHWQGKVRFNGQTAMGDIRLMSSDTITLSGCQLGMCKSFEFKRL